MNGSWHCGSAQGDICFVLKSRSLFGLFFVVQSDNVRDFKKACASVKTFEWQTGCNESFDLGGTTLYSMFAPMCAYAWRLFSFSLLSRKVYIFYNVEVQNKTM